MSKRVLIRNSMSGVVLTVTNVVVAFVMSPIIVHGLGNHNYGIWELLVGLVGYCGVLELGVGPALLRYVADSWSRNDRLSLNRIFNTGIVTLTFSGMIGLVIFVAVSFWPEKITNLQISEAKDISPVLVIFGLNLAASLPRTALSAYLLGLQAHVYANFLQMSIIILQSIGYFYVLSAGWNDPMVWMAWILFCATVMQSFILVFWILFIDRKISFNPGEFSFQTMKVLLGFGAKNTLMSASVGTLKGLVTFVIAYTSGVGQIAFYVIPNRFLEHIQSLTDTVGRPLTPYFTDLIGKGDIEVVRHKWVQSTKILQIISFGASLAAIGLGEPFIHIWMGEEYAEQGRYVLYILGVGLLFQGVAANSQRLLTSFAKHGSIAVSSAVLAILCFMISFILGNIWGVAGIAGAVFIFIFLQTIVSLVLSCRVIGMSLIDYFRATILHFIVPITLTISAFIGLRWIMYPDTYGDLILLGLIAGIFYLTNIWYLALNRKERVYIQSGIAGWIQQAMPKTTGK